jgi:hypothetical protein
VVSNRVRRAKSRARLRLRPGSREAVPSVFLSDAARPRCVLPARAVLLPVRIGLATGTRLRPAAVGLACFRPAVGGSDQHSDSRDGDEVALVHEYGVCSRRGLDGDRRNLWATWCREATAGRAGRSRSRSRAPAPARSGDSAGLSGEVVKIIGHTANLVDQVRCRVSGANQLN